MKQFSHLTIGNMILTAIIAVSFFVFPFLGVTDYFSCSFGSAVFKVNSFFDTIYSYGIGSSDMDSARIFITLFCCSFYIIIYGVIRAFFGFYTNKNQTEFNKQAKIGYIIDLVVVIIFFIIRLILLNAISLELDSYYSGLGGLGSGLVSDIIIFRAGYYIILICSIIGLVLPRFLTNEVSEASGPIASINKEEISKNIKGVISTGKEFINKSANKISDLTSDLKNQNNESLVKLTGNNQVIDITELPASIGSSREQADNYVYDNTINARHCELYFYEDSVLVTDTESLYGTYLNEEKVEPENFFRIEDGDILKLGDLEFKVSINNTLLNEKYGTPMITETEAQTEITPDSEETVSMYFDNMEETFNDNELSQEEPVKSGLTDSDKTVFLGGSSDLGETIKLNFDDRESFPTMALFGIADNNLYKVNKSPFIVGSDPNRTDLCITEPGVSKRHVSIENINNEFFVTDLNSTNGTKVNGVLISSDNPYLLEVGDVITIGEQEYRFEDV